MVRRFALIYALRADSECGLPACGGDAGHGSLLCGGGEGAQDIPWAFALLSWAVLLIDGLAAPALVPGTEGEGREAPRVDAAWTPV
jgi:hypothetical protein